MDQLDGLEARVEQLISELSEIIHDLERNIDDPEKAVSFRQVKEIESSITRLKKQGLPVPTQFNELKINLLSKHDRHKARIVLHQKIQESIEEIMETEEA
jgi:hypothetical protein